VTHESSTEATILFTGFPGFIGARLLPRILELRPGSQICCLVQERFAALAGQQIGQIEARNPKTRGRIRTLPGDITMPGLGIATEEARSLRSGMVGCFHLAAVYDLAVAKDVALRINVQGTKHVLEFVAEASRFERLDYVSTAYVSGTATGSFRESDLEIGQSFKNHYEETKYLAEVLVAKSGLPRTIYRPGIVVGDSRTGETAKFDGPYFLLAAFEKLPSPGVFIRIGGGGNPVNLVPVDYVIEGLARLSASPASLGKTYHLTDPSPMAALDIARLFARLLGKRFAFLPVPLAVAKALVGPAPVQRFFGLPVQALDYFDNPCRYDSTEATRDLGALGLSCPRLPEYAATLVEFYRARRNDVRRQAMI
jgi:thioester reductase-like protein